MKGCRVNASLEESALKGGVEGGDMGETHAAPGGGLRE